MPEGSLVPGSSRPPVASDVTALVVTHDGERHIEEQLDSILTQTVLPGVVLVVDDASLDGTRAIVAEVARSSPVPIELVPTDGSGAPDLKTRVAGNVQFGLAMTASCPVTMLADQDDVWLPDRLETQRALLLGTPGALVVAGDGVLVDENGAVLGGRLRDRFPVPDDWGLMAPAARMRMSLRMPFVTGAAMAVTSECVELMTPIPAGWLHDRWATLVAAARDGLLLQIDPVVRYRVHAGQALGDRQMALGADGPRWRQVLARGASPMQAVQRARHVVSRIRPLALDDSVADELGWTALVRSARATA